MSAPAAPPCPADAAAPGRGAVGRVRGAREPALQGALAARVRACVGRAALRGRPRRRAVHAPCAGRSEGRGGWDGGVGTGGARGRRGARVAAWTTSDCCPRPLAADASPCPRRRGRGTTGWTARHCATTCLGCARARLTAPRVCAFGAVRRATPRGWCCSLWTTRTAIGCSWGMGLRSGVL